MAVDGINKDHSSSSGHNLPLEPVSQEEVDDEFDAIIAAEKVKRTLQQPRQLHKPSSFNASTGSTRSSELNGSKAVASASTVTFPLFASASHGSTPHMDQLSPSISLFSKASSVHKNGDVGSTASLFSSARSLRNEELSHPTTKNEAASHENLLAPVPVDPPSDTTEAEATRTFDSALVDDELEAFLHTLPRNKPKHSPSNGSSLFQPARVLSTSTAGTSLFASAKALRPIPPFDHHLPSDSTTSIHGYGTSAVCGPETLASLEEGDDNDEFEAFLSKLATKRSQPKKTISTNPPSSSRPSVSPSSSTASNQSLSAGSSSASNRGRFKAPAVISPLQNQLSISNQSKYADDRVHDALMSLLEEDEDASPSTADVDTPIDATPPQQHQSFTSHFKSPPLKKALMRVNPNPLVTPEKTPPSSARSAAEHEDLLSGIDYNDAVLVTTPSSSQQHTNTSTKRFYSAAPPTSPSTPSPNRRVGVGISNRTGIVRSSPYSLTTARSMPIVTSTPNDLMKVSSSSPTRYPHSAAHIPSPPYASKRSKAAFMTPQKKDEGEARTDDLVKRHKQVSYGRTSASSSLNPSFSSSHAKSRASLLFNIHPTEEQRMARKPLSSLGRHPHHGSRAHLQAYKLRPDVINMTSDSAKLFQFEQMDETGTLRKLGALDMYKVLLADGASAKHLSQAWVENHYRWIVWKLASMERSFPHDFANVYLTPERTLAQLKYRYEREINNAQRPCLRKICEHDAVASLHMVLMVSAIRHDGTVDKSTRVTGDVMPDASRGDEEEDVGSGILVKGSSAIIEVSDGWYCIHAILDPYLTRLVQDNLIFVGQKLHIFGASIVGNDNPTPPLEVTASTMLKLQVNGVRRAKWDEKLGFSKRVPLPSVRIASLKQGGGIAPKLDALILRVYPLVFTEEVSITPNTASDAAAEGSSGRRGGHNVGGGGDHDEPQPFMRVSRNANGEDVALERWTKRKGDWIERKTREITLDVLRNEQLSSTTSSSTSILADEGSITNAQQEKIQERLREAIEVEPWLERQVTPVLRILICDYPGKDGTIGAQVIEHLAVNGADGLLSLTPAQKKALHSLGKATLTIYNITEDSLHRFKEGSRIQASFIAYKGDAFIPAPSAKMSPSNGSFQPSSDDPFALLDLPDDGSDAIIAASPLARLSTTTYSGFEFPATKDDRVCKTLFDLFGRVSTPFDALDTRLKLRDVPVPQNSYELETILEYERRRLIDRFTISQEFDAAGIIVGATQRVRTKKCKLAKEEELNELKDEYQWDVFLADASGQLLSLRFETILDNLPKSSFPIGSVLCFKNAMYQGYDQHFGVHSATCVDSTEWFTKPPSSVHLKAQRNALVAWMTTTATTSNSNEFEETMELLSSKIVDIQASTASKSKPDLDMSNSIFRQSPLTTSASEQQQQHHQQQQARPSSQSQPSSSSPSSTSNRVAYAPMY